MPIAEKVELPPAAAGFRNRFARSLGVNQKRKEEIYLDLARSASLRDVSFWLQVLFSAGIATLGLILNSPAVIIGAMLISPLMGPILANGLSLATGDLVLGLRAMASLVLSCLLAIGFSALLVYLLPFKDQTAEIIARTHPNTLDLVVALFSGAVGSLAICKKVKGVVTSIPGVAIAVALMPPLCVVGFGLGVAVSEDGVNGFIIARGGGLLFLTNLVAITFTAMLVFLGLHIDTARVRDRIRQLRAEEDHTGRLIGNALARIPGAENLKRVGSLPGRIILIVAIILALFVPLSRSFNQLRGELKQKHAENQLRQIATAVWEENFARFPGGAQRSYLGPLTVTGINDLPTLHLRTFTIKPLTSGEESEFRRLVAQKMGRQPDWLNIQLVEIPTASKDLVTKSGGDGSVPNDVAATTVGQSKQELERGIATSLGGLQLPPPAQLLDYEVTLRATGPMRVRLFYLSSRDIDTDGYNLLTANIQSQFVDQPTDVSLSRVENTYGPVVFGRGVTNLSPAANETIDRVSQVLREWPKLRLLILTSAEANEADGTAEARAKAIIDRLVATDAITTDRIKSDVAPIGGREVMISVGLPSAP